MILETLGHNLQAKSWQDFLPDLVWKESSDLEVAIRRGKRLGFVEFVIVILETFEWRQLLKISLRFS